MPIWGPAQERERAMFRHARRTHVGGEPQDDDTNEMKTLGSGKKEQGSSIQ